MSLIHENFLRVFVENASLSALRTIQAGQETDLVVVNDDRLNNLATDIPGTTQNYAVVVLHQKEQSVVRNTVVKVTDVIDGQNLKIEGIEGYDYSTYTNAHAELVFDLTKEQLAILRGTIDKNLVPDGKAPTFYTIGNEDYALAKIYSGDFYGDRLFPRVADRLNSRGEGAIIPKTEVAGDTLMVRSQTSEADPGCFEGSGCFSAPEASSRSDATNYPLLGGKYGDLLVFTNWAGEGFKGTIVARYKSYLDTVFPNAIQDGNSRTVVININGFPREFRDFVFTEEDGDYGPRWATVTFTHPETLPVGTFIDYIKNQASHRVDLVSPIGSLGVEGGFTSASAHVRDTLYAQSGIMDTLTVDKYQQKILDYEGTDQEVERTPFQVHPNMDYISPHPPDRTARAIDGSGDLHDEEAGFILGSTWYDTTTNHRYRRIKVGADAPYWRRIEDEVEETVENVGVSNASLPITFPGDIDVSTYTSMQISGRYVSGYRSQNVREGYSCRTGGSDGSEERDSTCYRNITVQRPIYATATADVLVADLPTTVRIGSNNLNVSSVGITGSGVTNISVSFFSPA